MADGEADPTPPEQPQETGSAPSVTATRAAGVIRALSLLAAAAHYARRVIESAELSDEEWQDPQLGRVLAELREAGERIEESLP
jgi:hypothetical protein